MKKPEILANLAREYAACYEENKALKQCLEETHGHEDWLVYLNRVERSTAALSGFERAAWAIGITREELIKATKCK